MAHSLESFRLAGHRVDPSLNRITTPSGETVQVEPKIMQVLATLAERPGDVVTRDDLMARVWNGVFVTDDALHRAIRELRRVFGDDAERPRVIETIRKRGYRLIGEISGRQGQDGQDGQDGRDGQEGRDKDTPPAFPAPPALPALPAPPAPPAPPALPAPNVASWRPGPLAVVGLLFAAAVGGTALVSLGIGRPPASSEPRARFMPFTSDPGNEVDPAMSPSGRLAYVARGADGRPHVFAKPSPDGAAVQLTHADATDRAPVWSPDEARLAFARIDARGCAIWIAAADGREGRELTACPSPNELKMSWSPDGQLLAVTAGDGTARSPSHIAVIAVADGQTRALTDPPPGQTGDWAPAFSPDGREIAFVRTISGSIADVFAVPVGGGAPRRITSDNADVLGVDWEPDGRHVVFSSERAGGIGLWRIDASADAGQRPHPTLLAGGGAKLKHPTVSRRTGVVAYEEWQYEINLRDQGSGAAADRSEAARDDARSISATADRWNFHPQISPDGRRLVFQSTRSGQYELWLSDRDGNGARPLTRSGVYKSLARWSPDSTRVAFTMRTETGFALDLLDVDRGAMQTLTGDHLGLVAPSWSHDGRALYVGLLDADGWQIWRVDVATGERRRVTTDGGYAAVESPDGRWLYVARLDRRGLWRRPVEGGAETLVTDRVQAEQWPNWGLLDRGFYFVTWPDDGDPQLAIVEPGSAEPRLLGRLPDYAWPGIAVSRDAARVIYAHADRRAANIGALDMRR